MWTFDADAILGRQFLLLGMDGSFTLEVRSLRATHPETNLRDRWELTLVAVPCDADLDQALARLWADGQSVRTRWTVTDTWLSQGIAAGLVREVDH